MAALPCIDDTCSVDLLHFLGTHYGRDSSVFIGQLPGELRRHWSARARSKRAKQSRLFRKVYRLCRNARAAPAGLSIARQGRAKPGLAAPGRAGPTRPRRDDPGLTRAWMGWAIFCMGAEKDPSEIGCSAQPAQLRPTRPGQTRAEPRRAGPGH